MNTRKKDNEAIHSQYFLLPARNIDTNETPREYAERVSQNIYIQINMQINAPSVTGNQLTNEERKDKISDIARDLIAFTRQLPHKLALFILFGMANHPEFNNTPARDILLQQIHLENLLRSPLNTEPCTLETILKFHQTDRQDVEDFLVNPTRLMIWMNNASALEISRLIRHFYSETSPYLLMLRATAKAEHDRHEPGKAFVCYALMSQCALNDREITGFAQAANKLNAEEHQDVINLLPSIKARAIASKECIRKASNRFIHCHSLNLPACDFSKIVMDGAILNRAKLDGSRFTDAIMTETQLQNASLTKCDFTHAFLYRVNLRGAILHDAVFLQADLRDADLSESDLTNSNFFRANLINTNFTNANLNNVRFFNPSIFKFKEILTDELNRLTAMLSGHVFEELLQQAILNNFLKFMQELELPSAAIASILELAYNHPLFSTHRNYDMPLAVVNFASKGAEFAIARFWHKKAVADIKVAYETPAQQAIYQEWLARTTLHDKRPPKPDFSPVTPK